MLKIFGLNHSNITHTNKMNNTIDYTIHFISLIKEMLRLIHTFQLQVKLFCLTIYDVGPVGRLPGLISNPSRMKFP